MKAKYYFLAGLLGTLVACSPTMNLADVQTQKNIKVGQDIAEKKELKAIITPYKNKLEESMNQKIAYTAVELNKDGDNSNLGEVLTDFTLDKARVWGKKNGVAEVHSAILNIGGIRTIIAQGDILLRHIFEVMPFENEVVIVKMKGEDIQGVFDYYARTMRNNPVAGFNIEVEKNVLTKGLINGEKPQAGKTYYIATSDYLALGGDEMYFFGKGEVIPTGFTLREVFIEAFKNAKEVKVKGDTRLKFVK